MRIELMAFVTGAALACVIASIGGADHASSPSRSTISCSSPERLTVKAGTTVTWTNRDDIPHTVAAKDRLFKSKVMDTDELYLVHILDTRRVHLLLLLASAHDGNHRGRGRRRGAALRNDARGAPPFGQGSAARWPVTCTIRSGRGVFATPRCRISTRSIRWRAICCATPPMPRTRCRSATCGR